MSTGLCGSHRTGKSTLARLIAARTGTHFERTDTTRIFNRRALDPASPMDFATRLSIQQELLDEYQQSWQRAARPFITDRTPVDLMAYTLADIQGATVVDSAEVEHYIARCFEVTNKFFNLLVIVQPGIPIVYAPGKAALNKAYIEHINTLIIGLCYDERLTARVACLPRSLVDLEARMRAITNLHQ